MKLRLNRVRIVFAFFCLCFFATLILFIVEYNNQISFIKSFSYIYLENAVYSYRTGELGREENYSVGATKMKRYQNRLDNYALINYSYDKYQDSILFFTENEEWEYRTLFIHDTVYNRKVTKKPNIHIDQLYQQSFLMLINELDPDSILRIQKNKLEANNIHLGDNDIHLLIKRDLYDSIEYLTYRGENNLKFNYTTPIYYTGYMDEIMYQSFLNITFKAVYRLMHKPYYNLIYSILIVLLGLSIWFYLTDYFRRKSTTIKDLGNNRYLIGHLTFDHDKQKLYYDEDYSMTTKTADLLLMFLRNKDHSVDKTVLLDQCVHLDNLTSALHRIRKVLRQAGAKYELYNIAEEHCYRLEVIRKNRVLPHK